MVSGKQICHIVHCIFSRLLSRKGAKFLLIRRIFGVLEGGVLCRFMLITLITSDNMRKKYIKVPPKCLYRNIWLHKGAKIQKKTDTIFYKIKF